MKSDRESVWPAIGMAVWLTFCAYMFTVCMFGCGYQPDDDNIMATPCAMEQKDCGEGCDKMTDATSKDWCRSYCKDSEQWCLTGN